MAADIEEEAFTERKTMRKTAGNRQKKLLVDHRVEVRSFEEGFQGSWHSGTVVACKKAIRRVQYDHLLFDDRSSSKLIDFVEVPAIVDGIISTNSSPSNYRGWIRPLPPPLDCDIWLLHYGQCVDMFYQDAWWEGVVFDHQDGSLERVIFFPDMGDEMKVHIDDLRITQDWDENTEVWKPRGNWLFLEVIEEIEKDWPLLVSVRQIWYDVRVKNSFENLKEWTSSLSDIWKELALQVIVDNFKITVKEFFHHSKSSANLLQGGYQLLELNEFDLDALLKQKAYFGDSHAIVPVETTGQLNRACCHPFEEEIGWDDLASVMESDRLDKIPLASSSKPSHEAPCLSSPSVAILPFNPDELSKDSSNFKMPKRRTRHAWIPAGPDIVPVAEYCADAINEYCKFYSMSKAGHKRLVDIKLNARKHLAFLGWKIEISREKGVQRVRYVQPGSDGKCFPSLTTVCEYLRESDSKPDELSLSTNSKMCIQSTQRNWLPASLDVVPEAEFGEDAIIEYYNIFKAGNLPPKDLAVNAKKHLSFLGWKIEYLQEKDSQRWRYTRPGCVGKCFESLIKVCEYLRKSAPGTVSLFPQDEHLSPLIEQSQGCKDKLIKPSPNFIVESEYRPEAVTDYYFLGVKSKDDPRKWKRDDKLKDMQLKAKKHLSAVGWRFYYTYRKDNKGSRELRYSSPSGKVYTSLLAACKGYVVEERNVWKEAEGQLTSEASLDVHGTFISQRPLSEKSPAEPSGLSLSSEVADLGGKVKVQRIRKSGRKRKSSAPHLASWSSKSLKKEKDLKEGQTIKSRENLNVAVSTHVLRSSKRARQVVVPSSSHSNPRTVLSWLIDNNVVLPRAKVQYRGRRDEVTLAEGRVTRDGIRCSCCQDIFTLSNFEGHAGSIYHRPSANIFLEDGRSLLDCQLQLKRDINARSYARESREMKSNQHHNKNDYICSVCHFGGELVLCDRCPSSFHTYCLGLKEVPDGDWFCPSCCCKICGHSKINKDMEEFTDNSVINCHQCELQYHIGCLRMKGLVPDGHPKGLWFCNKRCEQISLGLQKLLGKPVPVGVDNLTWTLLRCAKPDSCDHDPSNIEDSTETYSKLNVALGVMHECFEPVKEPRTRRDLVEDVIFNRWSELNRLNFRGFYTVLLEKNDELITAATVRVYGEKVAEVPLVATRFLYRRRGMCRILMNELEKALMELGVERLVLPAVSSVLDTWISSFGFSRMTETERLNYLDYTFLDFQGTIMCQKLLIKTSCTESVPPRTGKQLLDVITGNDNMDLEGDSAVSEIFQADRVEDSGTVDQKSGNTARGNGSDGGGKDAGALVLLVNQPTGFESIPCQSEISLESLVEASDYKEDENLGNGQIICYKRRRISKPVGAEVSAC